MRHLESSRKRTADFILSSLAFSGRFDEVMGLRGEWDIGVVLTDRWVDEHDEQTLAASLRVLMSIKVCIASAKSYHSQKFATPFRKKRAREAES